MTKYAIKYSDRGNSAHLQFVTCAGNSWLFSAAEADAKKFDSNEAAFSFFKHNIEERSSNPNGFLIIKLRG